MLQLPAWHKPVYFTAVFLMFTNSAINPILYGGLNENFRHGARDLFNCLLCRKGARSNLTMSTHLSLSRPRVSLVEDEGRKVKDKEANASLRQLAVSAAYINTTLATTKGAREEPKDSVVTFGSNHVPSCQDDGGPSLIPQHDRREQDELNKSLSMELEATLERDVPTSVNSEEAESLNTMASKQSHSNGHVAC